VQTVVEVHEGVPCPDLGTQFVARNQIASTLKQHSQHLQGLSAKSQFHSSFAELDGAGIELECVKTQALCGLSVSGQCKSP